jgi:uncharacterized membrane protein
MKAIGKPTLTAKFLRAIQIALENVSVKMFIFVGFGIGLLYILGTPPYYMLDEPNHFFRAYQVSDGSIIPEKRQMKTGGAIPSSLAQSVYVFRFGVQEYQEGNVPIELIRGSLFLPLNEDDTSFVSFSNTAIYSPIPYLPQAASIFVGRQLRLSPLVLMYIGRMSNFVVALILLAIAMHMLPVYRWVMFLVILSPTGMFQITSLSADALLFALSFLFIAMVFRELFGDNSHSWKRTFIWLLILSALIGLSKAAYITLPLIVLLIPSKRIGGKMKKLGAAAACLAVQLIVIGSWSALIKDVYTPFINPDINPQEAIASILNAPFGFALVLLRDIIQHSWFYACGMVSYQWNQSDILLPDFFSAFYLLVILITALFSGRDEIFLDKRRRIFLAVFAVLSIILIQTSVYISWMPPGSSFIEGIQGRYFIPVILPVLLIFYNRKFKISVVDRSFGIVLPALCFVSLLFGLIMFHRLF